MALFLLRRLGLMILTLWILSLIVFFAGQILPGDPGRAILGPFAAKSSVVALDTQLGVNRPLLTRYLSWIGGALHGNLGGVLLLPHRGRAIRPRSADQFGSSWPRSRS